MNPTQKFLKEQIGPVLQPLLLRVLQERPIDVRAFLANALKEGRAPMNSAVNFEEVSFEEILRQRAKTVGKLGVLANSLPILADLTQPLTQIDGKAFTMLCLAGFIKIADNKAELNKINVFPIADGDTGTSKCNI
jgi:hypothetical protein